MSKYVKYGDLNWSKNLKRDLSGKTGTEEPDRVVIQRALLKAEGVTDAYLGVRYELPLDDDGEGAAVKDAVENIAKYKLYVDHDESDMPDKVDKAYDEALMYLKELGKKIATLGLDTDDELEAGKSPFSSFVRG